MLRDLTELSSDLAEPFHSNARNLNLVGQRREQMGEKTHKEMEPILAYFAENKNKKDSINTDLINTQRKTKKGWYTEGMKRKNRIHTAFKSH